MPTSHPFQIETIVRVVMHLSPKAIMEIGPGMGKYGVLFREYLDVWGGESSGTRTKIDCCEVFPDYISPCHRHVYDNVIVGNVTDVEIKGYDLVVIIDVLEHLDLQQAGMLIRRILESNTYFLVSVPFIVPNQHEAFENTYEAHLSQFDYTFFKDIANCRFFYNDFSIICLLSKGKVPHVHKAPKPVKQAIKDSVYSFAQIFPELFLMMQKFKFRNVVGTRDLRSPRIPEAVSNKVGEKEI